MAKASTIKRLHGAEATNLMLVGDIAKNAARDAAITPPVAPLVVRERQMMRAFSHGAGRPKRKQPLHTQRRTGDGDDA